MLPTRGRTEKENLKSKNTPYETKHAHVCLEQIFNTLKKMIASTFNKKDSQAPGWLSRLSI